MQQCKCLKDLNVDIAYDPAKDGVDLAKEFYNPCLSVSKRYDRISAYFSSSVLKSFCVGIHQLINNGGHIRFIFSNQINESDFKMIKEAYEIKCDDLSNQILKDTTLLSDFEVSNLSFLIKHGLAEVKIAFMLNSESSICHIKTGLFTDQFGNVICFNGSGNETENGISRNADNFYVFRSFNPVENEYVKKGIIQFNEIWNNSYSSKVFSTFPKGKLFDTLCSFAKSKSFQSAEGFYRASNIIFVEIEQNTNKIILNDFTDEQFLKYPTILNSFGVSFKKEKIGVYTSSPLNLHNLKDLVVNKLKMKAIPFLLSPKALEYIKQKDLEINKRISLASAIKNDTHKDLWSNEYFRFKSIVDKETTLKLKDIQMKSSFFHYVMKSSADFSVPGTGKTFISYGLYAFLTHNHDQSDEINKMLVLGPLNSFPAWINEGKRIFENKRSLTFFDIRKHKNDYENVLKDHAFHVYLFNYDFFNDTSKSNSLMKYVLDEKTLLILDEAHKLKSINGLRSNQILRMLNNCPSKPDYRLVLTGTPLPNSFKDIYNYLRILFPEDLPSTFSNINLNGLNSADVDFYKAEDIRKTLMPVFVRVTKSDLSVPKPEPDDDATLCVYPTEAERDLFEYIWKNYNSNPLLKYIRLIQASSNPKLLKNQISSNDIDSIYSGDIYDSDTEHKSTSLILNDSQIESKAYLNLINSVDLSSKTKVTINFIVDLVSKKEKVLVWCLFIETIKLLKEQLCKRGVKAETIYGADFSEIRERKIDDFKNGKFDVLITNPNTLAESVSLHMVCHRAIYLEYGFNLTYLLQSKDRINRVGLLPNQKTYYYFSICKQSKNGLGSIDELIIQRLKAKEERMLKTIESNELCITGNSDLEDIEYIKEILSKGHF